MAMNKMANPEVKNDNT